MPEHLVLAFDYGARKIGVAIGNTLTRHARPLTIVVSTTRQQRFLAIEQLLNEWQPDFAVVGLPLTLDDQEQIASLQARRFAHQLQGRFGVRVHLVDERGSSLEAQQLLGNNQADDAMAAAVILQRYLDALP